MFPEPTPPLAVRLLSEGKGAIMRAAVYTETGPASVLHIVERDIPEPGPGEVRVRIVVSAVNPTDTYTRAGRSPDGVSLPRVPDQDGAGVVDRVGAGAAGLAEGDRVWVWDAAYRRAEGTAQEYVVLPHRHVVKLPDAAGFDLGADLGIPALTAHRALTLAPGGPARLAAGALAGTTVLVAGGAGAVGNAAIQLAKWAGGTVLTTVSSAEKGALARAAGADTVINYREEDVAARIGTPPDLIVEVDPGNVEMDAALIVPGGVIALYGGGEISMPSRPLMSKNIILHGVLTYTTTPRQKDDAVAGVADAVAAGAFRVGAEAGLPLIRFPLDRIADAHEAVENHVVGKVIVDVTAP
jgi:NADPH2:quinone reductase